MKTQNTLPKAIELFRQGMHYQSLQQISQILKLHPDEGKAWELKGLIEDTLSCQHMSIRSLETATTLIPISASGQYVLAKNYLIIGKRSLAKSIFSILLQRTDIPEKLLPAISSYLGQYPDMAHIALEACRKAVQLNPENGESWLGTAYFMGKVGHPKKHIANVLRKAVSLDPENHYYRLALGNLLEQTGQVDEAYLVIKGIRNSDLSKIPCSECLTKLITIFSLAEDNSRRKICLEKLKQLQMSKIQVPPEIFPNRFTDSLNK
ncbi:MAG: hypothetical protein QM501_10900 [Gimesia sp.]